MKLWHISQEENNGYDTFSDAVVVAETAEVAKMMHPKRGEIWPDWPDHGTINYFDWAQSPEAVKVLCIGEAAEDVKPRSVICASFHAG